MRKGKILQRIAQAGALLVWAIDGTQAMETPQTPLQEFKPRDLYTPIQTDWDNRLATTHWAGIYQTDVYGFMSRFGAVKFKLSQGGQSTAQVAVAAIEGLYTIPSPHDQNWVYLYNYLRTGAVMEALILLHLPGFGGSDEKDAGSPSNLDELAMMLTKMFFPGFGGEEDVAGGVASQSESEEVL
ncbi:MAG: hypothetical protein LBJ92_03760 [Holosporales bacterium]|jgi:hypothetical protein|nr:hypothetical protein [Holosporales bacterium]